MAGLAGVACIVVLGLLIGGSALLAVAQSPSATPTTPPRTATAFPAAALSKAPSPQVVASPTTAPAQELESARAAQIADEGIIRIGVRSDDGQWPLTINRGGNYSGFEIDLAEEIVRRLFAGRVSIAWIPLTTADRLIALQSGEIDLLIRNTTHTRSREEFGLWTSNYFLDGIRLLVRRNRGYGGLEDLNGKAISVVAGTTTELGLYEAAGTAGVQITTLLFSTRPEAYAEFTDGDADAFVGYWSALLAIAQGDPAYQVVGELLPAIRAPGQADPEPLAIGIVPGEHDFRDGVDEVLLAIIADGTWQTFYDRWFPEPPPWTLEEMLAEPPPNK